MKDKRIIIKFSGEALGRPESASNLDWQRVSALARVLQRLVRVGYKVAVVLGGGNIFRGRMVEDRQISSVSADYMGMLATMINALALQAVLKKAGGSARVLAPFGWGRVWDIYAPARAKKLWSKNTILILAAGTGKPHFTTDTGLALRAVQLGVKRIFKATNVAGVYSADPDTHSRAKFYKDISYQQALRQKLRVMDKAAFALAAKHNLELAVFKYSPDNLWRVVRGANIGTKVHN